MSSTVGNFFHPAARRELPAGIVQRLISAFALGIILYHIVTLGVWHTQIDFHVAVHLFSVLILTFLVFSHLSGQSTKLSVTDILLSVISLGVGIYFVLNLDTLTERAFVVTPLSRVEMVIAILTLLLTMEAARRAVGLAFVIVILGFLLVTFLGPLLPGIWRNPGLDFTEILDATVWTRLQGIWDVPLRMAATYIILFLAFGKLAQYSGLGALFTSLCQVLAAGAKGGPAKMAVAGSALVGSVTAGPATNIAITGPFTIAMMKQIGYKPEYAGAVEAAASTGASIVPPVMTGITFIMAELTGTPFSRIMVLAAIPAFFYYFCLILQVHYQAAKLGMAGVTQEKRSNEILKILKARGHLLIPLILLVVLLLVGCYPVMAVIWAMLAVPLVAALKKETRMAPGIIARALAEAAKDMVWVAPACALSGIILVALFQTGLGSTFSHIVSISAGDSLLLLSIMGAAAVSF